MKPPIGRVGFGSAFRPRGTRRPGRVRRSPGNGQLVKERSPRCPVREKSPALKENASAGQIGAPGLGGSKRRAIGSTAPEPNCSGRKKKPRGGAGGRPDRGARIGRARTWGAIRRADNPTRQIVSVKRKVAESKLIPFPVPTFASCGGVAGTCLADSLRCGRRHRQQTGLSTESTQSGSS